MQLSAARTLICVVLLSTLFPALSFAKKTAGILYGYSAPSSDAASSRFSYGVQGTMDLSNSIAVGLTLVYSSQDLTYTAGSNSTQYKFNMFFILADANFAADGLAKGLYFGIKVGMTKVDFGSSNSAIQGSDVVINSSAMTYGPKVGFDYEIGKAYALGGEMNYLFVNSVTQTNDVTGQEASLPRFKVFNIWGSFKFYF